MDRPLAVERLEDRCLPSTLQAISLPPAGQPPSDTAAGASTHPAVSGDGRYVAFQSGAPNVVPGQTGGSEVNVFLLDRGTEAVSLVSHLPGNPTAAPTASSYNSVNPLISRDGRYIVYNCENAQITGLGAGGLPEENVVVYDRTTGLNTLVSHSTSSPTTPADTLSLLQGISADGRYILFASYATDLVPNQVTTSPGHGGVFGQLFLYDQTMTITYLVSHAAGQNNVTANQSAEFDGDPVAADHDVADDGTVAYESYATNLVSGSPGPSFPNVYVYSPTTQTSQLVSTVAGSTTVAAGRASSRVVISGDGSTVVYASSAPNAVPNQTGPAGVFNVFRYSRSTQTTTLVSGALSSATSTGDADSGAYGWSLAVSRDGEFVAFVSKATDLVSGQSGPAGNVFLYDARVPGLILVSGVGGSPTAGAGGVPDLDSVSRPPGGFDTITGDETRVLSMSDDGALVAYASSAPNLLSGQTATGLAGLDNVFLYRRATGQTALVSGANGSATATGDGESAFPAFSADGSVLAFHTLATNLIGGLFDGNGVGDVFAYTPASPGLALASGAAFVVPPVPGSSYSSATSADGRYTVFTSSATNLVTNQVTLNATQNVFLYDKDTGTTTLVNHITGFTNTTGNGGVGYVPSGAFTSRPPAFMTPAISADASFVVFTSLDSDLLPNEYLSGRPGAVYFVYLYNVQTGRLSLVNHSPGQPAMIQASGLYPSISADGRYVAYVTGNASGGGYTLGSTNLYDRVLDTTTVLATSTSPGPFNTTGPVVSDDGRFVAYVNNGSVYVYDHNSGTSALVSHDFASPSTPANAAADGAVISHDGSAVAFVSSATDLVHGQIGSGLTNVFLYRNDGSGTVSLVSGVNGSATATGNGSSDGPAIDGDGSYVAYRSNATNLVPGQTGFAGNIYEYNTQTHTQILVSHQAGSTSAAAGGCSVPVIDDDGHLVAYVSTASNLIPGQGGTLGVKNVFIWLRQTGANILASGQDGSPTQGGNADSDGPLLTRHSFPGFSSRANLVAGAGGTSVAYINTLVQVSLAPNTVASGSPAGSTVGTLSVTSLLAGQYLPPVWGLPAGEGNNASFALPTTAGAAVSLVMEVPASYASKPSYLVSVHVNVGFGDDAGLLPVYVVPPPLTVAINQAATQADATSTSPVHFTVVFSQPVSGFAGSKDVTLAGTAGATQEAITGSGTTYDVAVSGMTQSGTVVATVRAGVVKDADGVANSASTSSDNTVACILPTRLVLTTAVSDPVTAGSSFGFAVTAEDAAGQKAPDFSGNVTVALAINPTGDTLGGTRTVPAVNGVATFADLKLTLAGAGYTLQASTVGLAAVTTNAFTVQPGDSSFLDFAVPPGSSVTGQAISPAVRVDVGDRFGNRLTTDSTDQVTLAANGPGPFTAGSTATVTVSGGVAVFSNLVLGTAGTYTLSATVTGGATGATSGTFSASQVADDFDRPNSPTLGATWLQLSGAAGIQSDQLLVTGATAALAVCRGAVLTNTAVQARIALATSGIQYAGLVARYAWRGARSYYEGEVVGKSGHFTAYLYKNVGGAFAQLASAPVSSGTGTLRLEAVGSSLKLFLGGRLLAWAYDTSFTGGLAGVWGSSGATLDDFLAGPVATAAVALPFADNFQQATTGGQLSRSWAERSGNFAQQGNGQLRANGGANLATVSLARTAANVAVQADVTLTGSQYAGLVARYGGAGSMYLGEVIGGGGKFNAYVLRYVGGKWTVLKSKALTSGTGTLLFTVHGKHLQLSWDGVVVCDVTDGAISGPGLAGLRDGPGALVSAFSVAAL
jgi:hypothetical protein